ncbi:XrtA-associated tyrosine autokinase [Hydrogenophaga sp.]|uniref:XrtA-associated tyrosine autokinase n=1 Tax=Hydrogenophaga sp. TaxID=1904254 RepID=UPI0035B3E53E
MSSLIEKAAQRLEQLRQAGVSVGDAPAATPAPAAEPVAAAPVAPAAPVKAKVAVPEPEPEPVSREVFLDLDRLMQAGYVTPNAPRSPIADQYRVIKRPLLANATGKGAVPVVNGNLIMVTSALPGEGKSFTAVNLAMSLATELDYRVLLVDADVARPSLRRVFDLPAGPGLMDVLVKPDVKMSDVLLRTNIDKLSLLLSGTPHARATELLASDAMTRLLEEMAQRYPDRIIIFDSPPLLPTTEARVLATHMGQVVVVVQAERTLQSDLQHALATIENCPVKLMLLNQARGIGKDVYGYGYGYGYSKAEATAAA